MPFPFSDRRHLIQNLWKKRDILSFPKKNLKKGVESSEVVLNANYRKGNELLKLSGKNLSDGDRKEAKKNLLAALKKYNSAIKQKGLFPEAYNDWGNALSMLFGITGDESYLKEAVEKYMSSGLQFIINGTLEEGPFISAYEIATQDERYKFIFSLYILAIQVIKGKKISNKDKIILKNLKDIIDSPEILILLIDTLIGINRERQSASEGDEIIAFATKVLINVLIDK